MYTGIKQVRALNGQEFIDDFKKIHSFVVWTKYSSFFEVKKRDVWRIAKTRKVEYTIDRDLYVVKRKSMIIL